MRAIRQALTLVILALAMLGLYAGTAHAQKKTLVVALNQDPDILDPTLARTYVGRIVFSHICEKLYEIDEGLRISPQLAAAMPVVADGGRTVTIKLRGGVKFNDGTPMDAEAVKFSLDRHRTLKGSNRASELAPVDSVEVVDPLTVRLRLKAPYSPLLAQLTDRALIERIDGGSMSGDGTVDVLFYANGSTSGADVVIASRRDRSSNRYTLHLDPLVGNTRVD